MSVGKQDALIIICYIFFWGGRRGEENQRAIVLMEAFRTLSSYGKMSRVGKVFLLGSTCCMRQSAGDVCEGTELLGSSATRQGVGWDSLETAQRGLSFPDDRARSVSCWWQMSRNCFPQHLLPLMEEAWPWEVMRPGEDAAGHAGTISGCFKGVA